MFTQKKPKFQINANVISLKIKSNSVDPDIGFMTFLAYWLEKWSQYWRE